MPAVSKHYRIFLNSMKSSLPSGVGEKWVGTWVNDLHRVGELPKRHLSPVENVQIWRTPEIELPPCHTYHCIGLCLRTNFADARNSGHPDHHFGQSCHFLHNQKLGLRAKYLKNYGGDWKGRVYLRLSRYISSEWGKDKFLRDQK